MIRLLDHGQLSLLTSHSRSCKVDHRDTSAKVICSRDYLMVNMQHKSLKNGGTPQSWALIHLFWGIFLYRVSELCD